jgi:hypothetical protein
MFDDDICLQGLLMDRQSLGVESRIIGGMEWDIHV